MNDEIEPILIGSTDDLEIGSVENFEFEEINYAIYRLDSGFFATQGNCNCDEGALLSEANIEEEELECASCGETYSIVSGDATGNLELVGLRIYDVSEEDNQIYLNI